MSRFSRRRSRNSAEGTRGNLPWLRWFSIFLLVAFSGLFSFYNAGERVAVNLWFASFYRISLVGLVFSVFIFGMLTMFLIGLRYDRAIRDALEDSEQRAQQPRRLLPPPDPTLPPGPDI